MVLEIWVGGTLIIEGPCKLLNKKRSVNKTFNKIGGREKFLFLRGQKFSRGDNLIFKGAKLGEKFFLGVLKMGV